MLPTPRTILRHTHATTLAVALTAAATSAAHAQQPQVLAPERVVAAAAARDNARADTLERWAESMYGTAWQRLRAARLHERAAALRGDDPRAVQSWRMAAWLHSAGGNHSYARKVMERAAASAMAVGDVERAAGAYVDAALLALEAGQAGTATALLRRTRAALGSPLLPDDRRAAVLRRIEGETRLAQAWAAR